MFFSAIQEIKLEPKISAVWQQINWTKPAKHKHRLISLDKNGK